VRCRDLGPPIHGMQLTSGPLTIFYWTACQKFWGRAIGVVCTLEAAGKKQGTDFVIKEPSDAPPGFGMAYPQVKFASGLQLAQTAAVLSALGDELGLSGKTPEAKLLCRQYLEDMTDFFGAAQSGKLLDDEGKREKWFTLLEARLTKNSFFLGDEPTVVDYHGVFAFNWVEKCYVGKGGSLEAYPNVKRWWAAIKEDPAVKAKFDGPIALIP